MNDIAFQEKDFEKKVIEYFKQIGFVYKDYEEILSLRNSLTEVVLLDNLRTVIQLLNPNISFQTLDDVILEIKTKTSQASLEDANRQAHEFLVNGVKVENSITKITETIKIVDFKNPNKNEFIVTNQFKMISDYEGYLHQVPDIVIYLNGLPIVVFELKSPIKSDEEIIPKAFQQIKNYQKYLHSLFVFNIFNVISNKHINKYGSITANFERYSYWKQFGTSSLKLDTSYDPTQKFIKLLFEPNVLLNLLKNYIFFTDEESTKKVIAAYHQYYGVEDTKKSVIQAMTVNSQSQGKKAGIFWHTQGSGKTFSMVMLTKNVINIKRKVTTLVITDRNNLDKQITRVFIKAKNYLGQKIKRITSIKELSQELKGRVQNGVYFCTVQKFNQEARMLTTRNDILIIADEAHRSHRDINGSEYTFPKDWKEISSSKKFGYTHYLHQAFPHATFVGFTATPIESKDRTTRKIFGNYVSKYLMMDAEADGCIVNINYESRQKSLQLDPNEIDFLDYEKDKIIQKIKKNSSLASELIQKFKKQNQKIKNIVTANSRMEAIVKDFIKHYQTRKNVLKGKAMFVAFNRETALKYRQMIIQQAPELEPHLRVIITPNQQTDKSEDLKIIGSDRYREESAIKFNDADSSFKIAIVVNMWLTGFDVPCLDTIYIDKVIKKHNLMQAITRVNRVYTDAKNKDLVKESALVVDYIGIWKKLEETLSLYGVNQNTEQSEVSYKYGVDVKTIKDTLIQKVNNIYDLYLQNLSPFDCHQIKQNKVYTYDVTEEIQQLIIKNKFQSQFVKEIKLLSKLLGATLTILTTSEKIRTQVLMLAGSQLIKRESGRFDLDKDVRYMQQIIEKTIKYNRTIVYDEVAKKPISLSTIIDYIQKTNYQKNPDLGIQKNILAVKNLIMEVKKINIVRGEKLSKKLNDLLAEYNDNFIDHEKFFALFKFVVKEAQQIKIDTKELGLTEIQLDFYEIIAENKHSKSHYNQKIIKEIVHNISHKVEEELDQSWFYNRSKKQKVISEMLMILAKHNYPSDTCFKLQKKLVLQLENGIKDGRVRIRR